MLRKIFALIMVFSIFIVQAHASSQEGLKAAFDELTYSLTIEWDQKDQSFYQSKTKEFNEKVIALQEHGLTSDQLIEFAKSEIKDEKLALDLGQIMNAIQINKMSSSEANILIVETLKNSYSSGANWNGDTRYWLKLAIGVLLITLVTLSVQGKYIDFSGWGQPDDCCYYYYYE